MPTQFAIQFVRPAGICAVLMLFLPSRLQCLACHFRAGRNDVNLELMSNSGLLGTKNSPVARLQAECWNPWGFSVIFPGILHCPIQATCLVLSSMAGKKNQGQRNDNQNQHDEKQDATPDAAHDLPLFRMGCVPA